ncbi:glutathione synthetase-like [Antedon mediterranea]|uniref:glutathione synthetase-like n=1 Tax=Antedon mediterranea TaxID=105859 RepID=UPI003AF6666D
MTSTDIIDKKVLDDVIWKAKCWAINHGLVRPVERKDNEPIPHQVTYIPFMLTPTPFPMNPFKRMKKVQLDFNFLMYNVSRDYDFLYEVLNSSLKYDEFTRNLVEISKMVRHKTIKDRGSLDIIRCDYMLDDRNGDQFKQVEINMISVGAGEMSTLLEPLHRYTLKLLGKHEEERVPENKCLDEIAIALVRAWEIYGQPRAAILLVAETSDRAVNAHQHIEFRIHEVNSRISFIKGNLKDIGDRAILTDDQELEMDGYKIAVVYYRTGYRPDHYKTKKEWRGRSLAEHSCAIKCPSIGGHLAGTKSVQQALSEPGITERYIEDPEAVNRIRETFCKLYSLDIGSKGDQAVNLALENPDKFVLKPNRESGGNNIFGKDVARKLIEIKDLESRSKYILMEKIEPIKGKGYPITHKEDVKWKEMTSEIGIYGTIVGDTEGIVHTREIGHLLRTKPHNATEASLSTGICVLDCPYLT